MSKLLELLNKLKNQAHADWLTDGQRTTFNALLTILSLPEMVNLYGPEGSGKTFLAWALSRSLEPEMPYFPGPAAFESRSKRPTHRAIVDNVRAGSRTVRNLLAVAQRKDTRTLLIITRSPCGLGFEPVELPAPTPDDFDMVYRNLSLLEYHAISPPREGNLWDAIRAVI